MENKIKGKDEIVDINLVQPNTWNPKESIEESKENKERYGEIKKEIEKKGLFEAITVRQLGNKYEILDGYHRWLACKELGFDKIRINNLGEIDDKLARAITLIKEQKKVPISELKVADIVGWYKEQGVDDDIIKDFLGYDDTTYEEYSKLFSFDWSEFEAQLEPTEEESDVEVKEDLLDSKKSIIIKLKKEQWEKIISEYDTKGKKFILNKLLQ